MKKGCFVLMRKTQRRAGMDTQNKVPLWCSQVGGGWDSGASGGMGSGGAIAHI